MFNPISTYMECIQTRDFINQNKKEGAKCNMHDGFELFIIR